VLFIIGEISRISREKAICPHTRREMTEGQEEIPTIVLDVGGIYTRAGMGGDDGPKDIFPTLVGNVGYLLCLVSLQPKPL